MESARHQMFVAACVIIGFVNGFAVAQQSIPQAKTVITIHVKDASAESVAAELSKASGIAMTSSNTNGLQQGQNVTLNADKQPFWVVMREFGRQARLSVEAISSADGPRMILFANPAAQIATPQWVQGAFLFTAEGASRTHSLAYSKPDATQGNLMLRVRCYVDPQLTLLGYSSQLDLTEAVDDKGNSLLLPQSTAQRGIVRTESSTSAVEIPAMVADRPDGGKTLKSLKGSVRIQLITKLDDWTIAEMANAAGAKKAFPGGQYTITSLIPEPQNATQYILTLHMDWDTKLIHGSPASPLIELGSVRRAITIYDATGRELQLRGSNSRNAAAGSRDLNIYYGLPGAPGDINSLPAKLEWHIPIETAEVTVPVEFKDLPLP